MKSDVVCTLYEGDYHLGVAALVNSLVRCGFAGRVHIGLRGQLPPWVDSLAPGPRAGSFAVTEAVHLVFEQLQTSVHLTNYKAIFMEQLLASDSEIERLFYFDPDIVTLASWKFFQSWVDLGVSLCEETVNGTMPKDHPIRLKWIEFMAARGRSPKRSLSRYYNGGFVGVTRAAHAFIGLWGLILQEAAAAGLNLEGFGVGIRESPFFASDQDALNVAAMYCEEQLSTIGPEGMGFVGGGFTMSHANQGVKPWRKSFVLEALKGRPPLLADKQFFQNVSAPLVPFPSASLRWRRLQIAIATAIGRVYRRI